MNKPIYRAKDQWVLGYCLACRTLNYVEPHGTTARCSKCRTEQEHRNIPSRCRDMSYTRMVSRLPATD